MHSRDFANYPVSTHVQTLTPTRAQAARAAVEEKRKRRISHENRAARQRPFVRLLALCRELCARSGAQQRKAQSREST